MLDALRKLFDNKPERPDFPQHEIFAVGDIHGRADLLEALLRQIFDRAETELPEIIFLGDYVDRGPQSREVVDRLLADDLAQRFKLTFLKGNHEATLLDFLANSSVGPSWVQYGGAETLISYGVMPPALKGDEESWYETSKTFRKALSDRHLRFYEALEGRADRGCYLFAHAGVDPSKPLEQQNEQDLMWIREAFINDDRLLPRIIVHGHTPQDDLHHDERRIGLDLGGYQTGKLGAARLFKGNVDLITARAN